MPTTCSVANPPSPTQLIQVAYGAPVKAFKASAFSVKSAKRTGVVAMSAATDDIIEKMKTLTVRAIPLLFLGVLVSRRSGCGRTRHARHVYLAFD